MQRQDQQSLLLEEVGNWLPVGRGHGDICVCNESYPCFCLAKSLRQLAAKGFNDCNAENLLPCRPFKQFLLDIAVAQALDDYTVQDPDNDLVRQKSTLKYWNSDVRLMYPNHHGVYY